MTTPRPRDEMAGVKVTTVRLPRDLDRRVNETAGVDHRSFNAQVIVLIEEALTARTGVQQ